MLSRFLSRVPTVTHRTGDRMRTHHLRLPHIMLPLLIVYAILVVWMGHHVPVLEAPDAYHHYAVIDYIAETGSLPPRTDPLSQPWRQMTFHAPLYYLISSTLLTPADYQAFPDRYPHNPHARIGDAHAGENQNFVAHATTSDDGIWRVRTFSMLLGALSVAGVAVLAGIVFDNRRWVAVTGAALLAFNPQFLFVHASVSNDTLVITLATWTIVCIALIVRYGVSLRRVALLGVVLGLASLAKASGLTLLPIGALAVLWMCWRERRALRHIIGYGVLGSTGWLAIAGWWYIGNWVTLGDAAATSQIALATGLRGGAIVDLAGELRGMAYSFWGLFGWFNVSPPDAYYIVPCVLVVAAVAGIAVVWYTSRPTPRPTSGVQQRILLALSICYVTVFLAAWWQFHLQVNAAQGRLMFPLLPSDRACAGAWACRCSTNYKRRSGRRHDDMVCRAASQRDSAGLHSDSCC